MQVALIGFGEAARAFVPGWHATPGSLAAYDLKLDDPATRQTLLAACAAAGVRAAADPAHALHGADLALSLVTADQALAAAQAAAPHLPPGAIWCDMNSVAPDTKRAAAAAIGPGYVDVAVMSPVHPAGAAAPLLLSGHHADRAAALLTTLGFTRVRTLPGDIGRASAIKMIRSVMVKGIEALSAECALAAHRAGVLDEVLDSLDATPPPPAWRDRVAYNLERMLVHGTRRAAEMEQVVLTLDALGTGSEVSRATAHRQRQLGAPARPAPHGLPTLIEAALEACA